MKKLLLLGVVVAVVCALVAAPVFADPTDYDKKAEKGIYYLVSKDSSWNPLARSANAFGKGKFSITDSTLTMHLVCHKLTPGYYYYVELVDKGSDGLAWNVLGDDTRSRFYGQADAYGDIDVSFSWPVSGYVEVNVKNADWVALLDPSDYGNEDGDWIYTGQGWDYVLYGATTISIPSP